MATDEYLRSVEVAEWVESIGGEENMPGQDNCPACDGGPCIWGTNIYPAKETA